MVAVAIVGLLLEAGILWRRSEDYRRLVAYHALQEKAIQPKVYDHGTELGFLEWEIARCREMADTYRREQVQAQHELDAKTAAGLPTNQQDRRTPWYWKMQADEQEWKLRKAESRIAYFRAGSAYHRQMRARYERAASHPWESVEIEPVPWERHGTSETFQPDPPPP
jgi:hypothetical protein